MVVRLSHVHTQGCRKMVVQKRDKSRHRTVPDGQSCGYCAIFIFVRQSLTAAARNPEICRRTQVHGCHKTDEKRALSIAWKESRCTECSTLKGDIGYPLNRLKPSSKQTNKQNKQTKNNNNKQTKTIDTVYRNLTAENAKVQIRLR